MTSTDSITEEIKLFDVINTKAKGIGTSLSRYLNRDNDEMSWVATNLILKSESPLFSKGTLIGKRTRGKNIHGTPFDAIPHETDNAIFLM